MSFGPLSSSLGFISATTQISISSDQTGDLMSGASRRRAIRELRQENNER